VGVGGGVTDGVSEAERENDMVSDTVREFVGAGVIEMVLVGCFDCVKDTD